MPTGLDMAAGPQDVSYAEHRLDARRIFGCLVRAGRFRDEETANHVERMSRMCSLIAERLGCTRTM